MASIASMLALSACTNGLVTQEWTAIHWSSDGSRMASVKFIVRELDEFVGWDAEIWVAPAGHWSSRTRFGRYEDARERDVDVAANFAGPTEASGFFGRRTIPTGSGPVVRFGRGALERDLVLEGPEAECQVSRALISPDGARLAIEARCPAGPDAWEYRGGWAAADEPERLLVSASFGAESPHFMFWRVDGALGFLDSSAAPTRWFRLDESGGQWIDEVPDCFYPGSTASVASPDNEFYCVSEEDEDQIVPCPFRPSANPWRVQAFGCPVGGTLP